jgi:hypothetical protein
MENGGTEGAPRGDGPSLKNNTFTQFIFSIYMYLQYIFSIRKQLGFYMY